ncbi:MAG: metallophosphoesterase [Planctomycetota bacterium]|jgi:cytochrome c biogenesis protein CcdA
MKPFKLSIILLITLTTAVCSGDLSSFSIEPYLLDVTEDSATVAFHLNKPLSAKVKVYDADQVREFSSAGKSKSHFIKITELKEGSIYNYQVICGDGEVRTGQNDSSFQIKTSCQLGKSFMFAVYGDPRPGDTQTDRNHKEVIAQIINHEPVFCLVLGDMVDDGAKVKLWEDFFRIESGLLRRAGIYTVMGDNDYLNGRGLCAKYFPKLEKGYYKFEWGGVQFFGLRAWDTRGKQQREEINAESEQVRWLESELVKEEVQEAPFRVVFLHDPVYISRGKSSDTLRRIWAPILQKYKVDVVFASWHLYERSSNEGITYIISGGAGAELIWMKKDPAFASQTEARRYHFCRVDVDSGVMIIRAVATDGTILDSFTLTPKSQYFETTRRMDRAVSRLYKEILINNADGYPELTLYLFSSYDCAYCQKLLKHDLPNLAKRNNVALRVSYFDLSIEGTYELLLNAEAEFGRQDADIPTVFVGRSVLGGETEIESQLGKEIAQFRENPQRYLEQGIVLFGKTYDTTTIAEERFNALTYGIVARAGLLNGVNPYAFTTIIFLISYLSFSGVCRKQMFYTGVIFTLAVFFTYFAIGLASLNFLKLILRNQTIVVAVNSLLLLAVVILGVFSVIDFLQCLKGKVKDITLQLPGFLKEQIRERVRDFARNKVAIASTSFVLGVVIAGRELACTGQVYIPITTMISDPSLRIRAVFYLLWYNVVFILPLVAVFLLAAFGVTSELMGNVFRRHTTAVKMAFAVLFAIMAVMIIYNLWWL